MAFDLLTAMWEIVMSNKRRNNMGHDFFHPRYDVISNNVDKKVVFHVMTYQYQFIGLPDSTVKIFNI